MTPCPKCKETKWTGLKQYGPLNKPSIFQAFCFCGFEGPECSSPELAEEAWNTDPNGKFQQLSLLA